MTTDEAKDAAVALLRRLLGGAMWYGSALELTPNLNLDGAELEVEAKAIIDAVDAAPELPLSHGGKPMIW